MFCINEEKIKLIFKNVKKKKKKKKKEKKKKKCTSYHKRIYKTKAIYQQPIHYSYGFTIYCVVLRKTELRLNKGERKSESLLV